MKTIFIVLDHGLGLAYFLETELTRKLLDAGVRIVFLVQDAVLPQVQNSFPHPNVIFESMRDTQVLAYQKANHPGIQELIDYVRRASADTAIPLTYVDTHRQRKEFEARGRRQRVLKLLRPLIWLLRRSRLARRLFRNTLTALFTPHLYDDLFERYRPALVISDTAGWRLDQYLLREAHRRGIPTSTVIIGWDNPSSQGLPGADVDTVNVWSAVHRWEMTAGVDWPADKVHIGGMPLYDGYISRKWVAPREAYFRQHNLDPNKKLVAFAATALSISPNLHIIEVLADMIANQQLAEPSQLLIRLHPNHFKPMEHYRAECAEILKLAQRCPDVHVVEPMEVAGGLERYSGEDFPEKASMLAHCDVLVTIYSTMVVEATLHDKPIISVCINSPEGWKDKFWIPLEQVPGWPTAARVNKAQAGKTVMTAEELKQALNEYLLNPECETAERRRFVEAELTYLNGESTQKTADFLLSLLQE
ncbi:MAG TPA: hypothetical protein VFF68_04935 [Anaerolineaceae bacterium]|nr:hypothetical protein [Anaerolineaceae bacterium]